MSTKKLLFIFIPALLLVGLALFITILRYEPLFPKPKDKTAEVFTIPVSAEDTMIGLKRAPKTIVAFEDFSCPSCRQNSAILDDLIAQHPTTVKVVWKSLPVTTFPYPSEPVAKYGWCAQKQGKFVEFRDQAFANADNLSDKTLASIATAITLNEKDLTNCLANPKTQQYLDSVKTLATLLNIQSVPTFFVDSKQVQAPQTVAGWEELLKISAAK